ncbi:hypothetical protein TPA0909_30970 [Streptomyces albus]|nr:hypothetical protein TPA0909_30970 [Streptomyces albus]
MTVFDARDTVPLTASVSFMWGGAATPTCMTPPVACTARQVGPSAADVAESRVARFISPTTPWERRHGSQGAGTPRTPAAATWEAGPLRGRLSRSSQGVRASGR